MARDPRSALEAALRPRILGLHHVAIVVPSLTDARKSYVEVLGLSSSETEHVPDQKVNVLVCAAGAQRIELVEPAATDSPVAGFLAKRGPGLHHLAYHVDSVEEALQRLRRHGVRLIDERPRPGAHGTRIAFVHPSALHGVLTELVEIPAHGVHGNEAQPG